MLQVNNLLDKIANLSGGPILLQATGAADPRHGAPRLRVLGSRGPDPGAEMQGPLRRGIQPGRPHDAGRDPGQGVPEGTLLEAAYKCRKCSSSFFELFS